MHIHRDDGGGDPVVLIHGFPDTAHTWDGIADALLAEGHRVIVPHLRGYTRESIVPGRPYDAHTLATDVLELLDDLALEHAALVGHDWGAALAYGAASLAPERVSKIVAVAIPHLRTFKPDLKTAFGARHFAALKLPWAAAQFRLANFSGVDILYRRWAPGWSGPVRDECVSHFKEAVSDPAVLDGTLDYYRASTLKGDRRLLNDLPMPALLIGGDRDIVPPAAFEDSRRGFTGPFEAKIYAGSGHWPHRQDEARFIADVTGFLAD